MWDHSLLIWQFHNDAFHADTNAQFKRYKRYKPEELEKTKNTPQIPTHRTQTITSSLPKETI
jgi:hypothetical protein